MSKNDDTWQATARLMRRTIGVSAWLLLACILTPAQTTTPMDGYTPLSLAPGAPAGSYPLSGFDNVNLFNGNLNFSLPFLQIGGRGSARFTMRLNIENRWHIETVAPPPNCELTGDCNPKQFPMSRWWTSRTRWDGFTPGRLVGRQPGYKTCGPGLTVTRLTFSANDLTEFELRDLLYNGQPLQMYCGQQNGVPRGRVFVTADGTAATFIPDATIYDYTGTQPSFRITPSGYLMMRDGTRYRMDNQGRITSIQDRNGNRIDFTYDQSSGRLTMIKDSLNRVVNIYYALNESPYGTHDKIVFKGFDGMERAIRISYGLMEPALRSGFGLQSTAQLFPEADFPDLVTNTTPYNPTVTTALWLPDGRRYQFLYDSFGNLARVVLPTGGALEYDYGFAFSGGLGSSVKERRVYSDAGASVPDGKSVYSYGPFSDPTYGASTLTTVEEKDGAAVLLAKSKHYFFETAATPSTIDPVEYPHWRQGHEYKTEAYDTPGATLLRETANNWQQPTQVSWWTGTVNNAPSNNPRVDDTTSKLSDTNQVSKEHYTYDQYNNKTNVEEYDFGSNGQPGALVRRTHTGYLTSGYDTVAGGTSNPDPLATVHIRSFPTQQQVFDGGGVLRAQTDYEYDNYNQTAPDNFHDVLTDRSGITGFDGAYTTTSYSRGNVTRTTHALAFDSAGGVTNSISGYAQYDIAGNVVKAVDPRSTANNIIAAAFDFSDAYGYANNDAEGNENPLPVELPSTAHTYAFATRVTNALNQITYIQYDYYLGKPVNSKDANGIVSSARYDDALGRPTGVDVGIFSGSELQRHTSFIYNDSSHLITTESDQTTLNDGVLTSTILYDGLGRTTETRTSAPEGTIYTNQQYEAMGRVKRAYNPYRTTSDSTYGYADTSYDALGRVTSVTTSDNAVVTTTYSGNTTTVTDQAGKKRRSVADGLGRLIRVDEPDAAGNLDNAAVPPQPLQPTSYVYDALGNLIQVNQGSQQRLFTYDSLSRLKTDKNPEQVNSSSQMVETTYDYDAASNLLSKSGPNTGSSVSFTYDTLNRVKTKTLSSGGVWDYSYDTAGIPNAKGRLVSVVLHGTTDGTYYDSYDAAGRVTASRQVTTAGTANSYTMSYQYDLAGNMTQETYPSGKVFVTDYDSAGRIAGVKRGTAYYAGASHTDATNRIQYSAHGGIGAMKLGNGKWEHTSFNSRLQPTEIGLGGSNGASDLLKLEYTYSNSNPSIHDNNGSVLTQKITAPKTSSGTLVLTQNYSYDALNRLSIAEEFSGTASQWRQTYDIDRWGNRAVRNTSYILPQNINLTPTSTGSTDFTAFNQNTNRIALGGYDYDTAGNLKADPTTASNAMLYDAENRQTSYTKGGVTASYSYDGDGHRVKKIDNNGTTVFVYNAGGQLIAEYTSGPPQGSETSYLTSDHLGSTRIVTKQDGSVKARYDYLPFGEELPSSVGSRASVAGYGASDGTRQKFTQKERDSESGLDYFGARYYASAQGRFTGVDPGGAGAGLNDPQSRNGYAYARNNPLLFIDPDGFQSRPFGRANLRGYLPPRGGSVAADLSVLLYLVKNRSDTLDNRMWHREGLPNPSQSSKFFKPDLVNAEGYGIAGALATYEEHNIGLLLDLRFAVDEKTGVTNAFIDVRMGDSIQPDPHPTTQVWEPAPGWGQPQPEINDIVINTATLSNLSETELQAVASAGARTPNGPYAPIGRAIIQAVIDEQRRRAELDKKLLNEAVKRLKSEKDEK